MILLSCCLLFGSFKFAQADTLLEGAQQCTQYLPKAERFHQIPTHWLAAIASAESGRYHQRLGLLVPWPWTINVNGKGYYFDTKQEAINKVREYQAKGVSSIDVGCMQVNLMYHGNAFSNIEQAMEPRYNIAYAARFLRENFDELRSWNKATAAYHSRTPSLGSKYFSTVFGKWEKVVKKLGAAADSKVIFAERPASIKSNKYASIKNSNSKYAGYQVNESAKKHISPRMKLIKISKDGQQTVTHSESKSEFTKSRQNGVLVTRPAASSVKQLTLNKSSSSSNGASSGQPFIF